MPHQNDFRADVEWARTQDDGDPLRGFRNEFLIPPHAGGEQTYLVGNSLGLQPRGVRQALLDELDDWARLGVDGHLHGRHPWLPYHAEVRDRLAELVGAESIEVVAMNSLTVNLHLLLVSFYRPTPERHPLRPGPRLQPSVTFVHLPSTPRGPAPAATRAFASLGAG